MRKWIPAVLILATLAFSIAVFGRLPERVPIHWNVTGEVDRYGSRRMGAFLIPVLSLAIWGVLRAVPFLDPRRMNIEKFRDTYDVVIIVVVAMLAGIHFLTLGAALGWPIPIARYVPVAVGAMLVILGNLLPRFRSNFFLGIRTPWTLSSDRVWERTHRFGGYVMAVAGVLVAASGFVRSSAFAGIILGVVFAMAFLIIGYSYFAWRSENRGT